MTVTGIARPVSSKIWVMPNFLPMRPSIIGSLLTRMRQKTRVGPLSPTEHDRADPLQLDFDVHPGRQVQAHQRPNGCVARLEHVDQPLVRSDLKLLLRILVDK